MRTPTPKRPPAPTPAPTPTPFDRWLPFVVLAIGLGIYLYFFLLTHEQPVWWDEAEYLIKGRGIALGTPDTGFFSGRPLLLPVAISGVYAVGLGETAVRIAIALTAVATMLLTYRIGARLFGAIAGLVAATLLGSFYLLPFYASRVMTEVPHLALSLLAFDLVTTGKRRAIALSLPALGLAALTRFTAALMLPVLGVWALLTERRRLRLLLVSAALGAVVVTPYLIWATVEHGDPFHAWKASEYLMGHPDMASRVAGVGRYLEWLATSLGWFLGGLAILGLVLAARWVTQPKSLIGEERGPANGLLLWLWLLVPIAYFGLFVHEWQDRFLVLALPPAFLAVGHAVARIAERVARGKPYVVAALALAAMLGGAVPLLSDADRIVRAKLTSFSGLRDAGLWLKQNTPQETIVMAGNMAQLTYYSERATFDFPKDLAAYQAAPAERRPDYVVLSKHDKGPAWLAKVGTALVMQQPADKPIVRILRVVR